MTKLRAFVRDKFIFFAEYFSDVTVTPVILCDRSCQTTEQRVDVSIDQ